MVVKGDNLIYGKTTIYVASYWEATSEKDNSNARQWPNRPSTTASQEPSWLKASSAAYNSREYL